MVLLHFGTAAAGQTTSVSFHVVDRGDNDPIFTNGPIPLWTTCPVWIRPSTVIYTVQSVDEVNYNSNVYYRLESGSSYHTEMDFESLNLAEVDSIHDDASRQRWC